LEKKKGGPRALTDGPGLFLFSSLFGGTCRGGKGREGSSQRAGGRRAGAGWGPSKVWGGGGGGGGGGAFLRGGPGPRAGLHLGKNSRRLGRFGTRKGRKTMSLSWGGDGFRATNRSFPGTLSFSCSTRLWLGAPGSNPGNGGPTKGFLHNPQTRGNRANGAFAWAAGWFRGINLGGRAFWGPPRGGWGGSKERGGPARPVHISAAPAPGRARPVLGYRGTSGNTGGAGSTFRRLP